MRVVRPKIRNGETWERVRRAWEDGETAASVARRFDVGLANLWRRRAAEGWERREEPDPTPEPPEGWDRWADARLYRFLDDLETQRELALGLLAVLEGGGPEDLPVWHLGFYYRWRAGRLGAEVAAADRERARDQPWATAIWDADGRLAEQKPGDRALLSLYREDWRRIVGLPDGAAQEWP